MARKTLLGIATMIGLAGFFLAALGAKIDMTTGIQAQAFALADVAVAALLVIAANSFRRPV